MTTSPDIGVLLKMYLSMLVSHLPTLLFCIAGLVVISVKWKQAPKACLWAMLGLGLMLLLSLVMPLAYTLVSSWQMQGHPSVRNLGMIYAVMGFVWSGFHVVSMVFLLIAVFAGRPRPST